MNRLINMVFACSAISFMGCTPKPEFSISVKNTLDNARKEVVTAGLSGKKLSNSIGYTLKTSDNKTVPAEWIDQDGDGFYDVLLFEADLEANSTKEIMVFSSERPDQVSKRTQAEISIKKGGKWEGRKYKGGAFENVKQLVVPSEHTDHSNFIRYEGPGWESEYVAYRLYLDWRNGIDFFGKKTTDMVLQNVGQDGFNSYHELSDWGMDLLKVGNTLGLGSIGRYLNDSLYRFQSVDSLFCTIDQDGLLKSALSVNYLNWKTEEDNTSLQTTFEVSAGSPLTKYTLGISNPITGFCTGLVRNSGEYYVDKEVGNYRVLGTFGDFSLNNDKIGLAIIVENPAVESVFDGAGSHVVVFNPAEKVTYYLMAVWEQDVSAIDSAEKFEAFLTAQARQLDAPVQVAIK